MLFILYQHGICFAQNRVDMVVIICAIYARLWFILHFRDIYYLTEIESHSNTLILRSNTNHMKLNISEEIREKRSAVQRISSRLMYAADKVYNNRCLKYYLLESLSGMKCFHNYFILHALDGI